MVWNGGEMYNVVGHIGKGAFANVYKLATKQDGELFAAKELEKRRFIKDGVLSHKAHNEIDVMKQLNHVRMCPPNLKRNELTCSSRISSTTLGTKRRQNICISSWSIFHTVI